MPTQTICDLQRSTLMRVYMLFPRLVLSIGVRTAGHIAELMNIFYISEKFVHCLLLVVYCFLACDMYVCLLCE